MKKIFLVPHTHYDVAWAFSKEDYFQINEGILEAVLKLMKEDSEFKFCLEQTFLLEEMERRNPELWLGLKEMIKQGRLEIVDGQYLMPDTMLPGGEVLVREILFGKRYCEEKFGVEVPVAWAADSFGMNAQLPQIYQKAGYKWLAFRRGAKAEIMQSEFIWEGLDGSTILTHWMPLGYRAGLFLDKLEESFTALDKYAATHCILMPCGSGSMPIQPEIPRAVKEWNKGHPDIEMNIATPGEFFRSLEKEEKRFEVVEGELFDDELAEVFPQVCTSRLWLLQSARECEDLIIRAEEYATFAWLLGDKYPSAELRQAWEKILFVAFHDIITGCGVDEIYGEVREIFSLLKDKLSSMLSHSLDYIASRVNTGGNAVVVFNPLPWRMRNWAEVDLKPPAGWKEEIGLKGEHEAIDVQLVKVKRDGEGKIGQVRLGFAVDAPPMGYKAYEMVSASKVIKEGIRVERGCVETPFFKVIVNKENGILSVFDRQGELLLEGNELFIDDEIGDLYHHRSRFGDLIKSESGEGLEYGSFKPRSFHIEEGMLQTKLVFESEYYCLTWPYRLKERFPPSLYKYKMLDVRKEVLVYRDIPRIDFITRVDNKHPNIRLSVKFDAKIERKVYSRETQFGVVSEPTEYCNRVTGTRSSGIPNFLSWFDLSNGTRGITFMNRGLPANTIDGSAVYIRLFRSVYGLSADGKAGPLVPTPDALELRPYTFEYAIYLHDGDWRQASAYKQAQCFRHLPQCIQANSQGKLPGEFSFLKLYPDNLVLSTFKKAEDSDEAILRFFETRGEATLAEIELFREIRRAVVVNLLEREERELVPEHNKLTLKVKPFEIVTLKLTL
ncbi:MAG: glycoside hydrolase [Dehalococcoidia bacterium]|nr:glycoside hydrolase [Dehalococcoidia bacterium]